jgi:hypothetical protein
MRALAVTLTILLSAVSSAAKADDRIDDVFKTEASFLVQQASVMAVRTVIERQIEALRRDDAQTAFAFVAPRLKQRFVDSGSYMRVIREQFAAILTAKAFSFGDMRETSYGTAQVVSLSDPNGEPWLAFFLMDRDASEWRVANVVLVRLPTIEA